jgi:hypothetical protein
MESLGSDVQRKIALELSPVELVNLCSSNKVFNKNICNSYDFWIQKLKIDYPEEFLDVYEKGIKLENPKALYIFRFTEVAKEIEKFIPEFINYVFGKEFIKFFNEDYKKKLFKTIYSIYERLEKLDETGIDKDSGEYIRKSDNIIFDILLLGPKYTIGEDSSFRPQESLGYILEILYNLDEKYKEKRTLLKKLQEKK